MPGGNYTVNAIYINGQAFDLSGPTPNVGAELNPLGEVHANEFHGDGSNLTGIPIPTADSLGLGSDDDVTFGSIMSGTVEITRPSDDYATVVTGSGNSSEILSYWKRSNDSNLFQIKSSGGSTTLLVGDHTTRIETDTTTGTVMIGGQNSRSFIKGADGYVGLGYQKSPSSHTVDVEDTRGGTSMRVAGDVLIDSEDQSPVLRLDSGSATSTMRNWDIKTNQYVAGDFAIRVGASQGADPSVKTVAISSAGNVGIGTSPGVLFDVYKTGNQHARFKSTADMTMIIASGGSHEATIDFQRNSVSKAKAYVGSSDSFYIETAGAVRQTIDSSGNTVLGAGLGLWGDTPPASQPAAIADITGTATGSEIETAVNAIKDVLVAYNLIPLV